MFAINRKLPTEQRKGLYCKWVRRNEQPGAPLVAVWIDPAMQVFEKEAGRGSPGSEEILACEDGGERAGSSSRLRGNTKRANWWPTVGRGLAAALVWALVAIAAQSGDQPQLRHGVAQIHEADGREDARIAVRDI